MPHPTKKGEPRAPGGPLGPGLCSLPTASPLPRTGWGRAAAGDPSPPGVGGRILLTPTATQTGQRLGWRGTRGGCQDVSAEVPLAKIHPWPYGAGSVTPFNQGFRKGTKRGAGTGLRGTQGGGVCTRMGAPRGLYPHPRPPPMLTSWRGSCHRPHPSLPASASFFIRTLRRPQPCRQGGRKGRIRH